MLVKAMSPTEELALTSPFQSCHAHQPPLGKLSGWVPDADKMTYWALRLAAALVLPKWLAALTAS
jgi:hypothetical protein